MTTDHDGADQDLMAIQDFDAHERNAIDPTSIAERGEKIRFVLHRATMLDDEHGNLTNEGYEADAALDSFLAEVERLQELVQKTEVYRQNLFNEVERLNKRVEKLLAHPRRCDDCPGGEDMTEQNADLLAEVERLRERADRVEIEKLKERKRANQYDRDKLREQNADLLAALENYIKTYNTCPCGAWIGQESERPHVIGCPVGTSIARSKGEA